MHWGRVSQILQPAIHKSWTNDVHKQLVPLGDVYVELSALMTLQGMA